MILYRKGESILEKKPLTVTNEDLAISSVALKVDVRTLQSILLNCWIIDSRHLSTLTSTQVPALISRQLIMWEDKIVIPYDDLQGWEYLNLIYPMMIDSQINVLERALNTNQRIKTDLAYYKLQMNKMSKLIVKRAEDVWQNNIVYFSPDLMAQECRRLRIKHAVIGNKVGIEFANIKLTDNDCGIAYKKIIIFIKDWQIDGFMFRFKNFDYSSYWGVNPILHPYIMEPYGYSDVLSWLPKNNYRLYLEGIRDLATDYKSPGIASLKTIVDEFQRYRKLWASLQYQIEDRKELSKQIFNLTQGGNHA